MVSQIVDTFNRANSATGLGTTSDGNASWTGQDGTCGITSNAAVCVTPGSTGTGIATVPGAADGSVEANLGGASAQGSGPLFRWVDTNNFWTFQGYAVSNTSFSGLYSKIAGSAVKRLAVAVSLGDLVHIDFTGSTINVFVNGSLIGTVVDASLSTSTNHGVGINPGDTLDNFTYTFPPPPPPPKLTVVRQAVVRASFW